MRVMNWFLGTWATLGGLGALCRKRSEETWPLVLDSSKQGMELFFISSAKHVKIWKRYTVRESFADHMNFFIHASCFTGVGQNEAVKHDSLVDLFRIVLNTFDGQEALQGEQAPHFNNSIINKGSEMCTGTCNSLVTHGFRQPIRSSFIEGSWAVDIRQAAGRTGRMDCMIAGFV